MSFVPEIDCATDALDAAGTILRGRLGQIFELRDAVIRSDDIEDVHQMRVATRRLRSALRDLKPLVNKPALDNLVSNLKGLADSLGEARDDDVAIDGLMSKRDDAADQAVREGIDSLIDDRRKRRFEVQPIIVRNISEPALAALLASFNGVFLDPSARRSSERIRFEDFGRTAIKKTIDEFVELSKAFANPSDAAALHRLRIAAKRLRYALEFFGTCWGKKLKRYAKQIADMQTFLGDLHDADVWIEQLSHRREEPAADWLITELKRNREENYRDAFVLWIEWRRARFLRKVERVIGI
ncbi:MAG TPA: CHAD domain-containing protein [Pyrinomonadaceae bacterium]|nr:CHAD domain-containing protein [Pyrinomonadaceae bacterium]